MISNNTTGTSFDAGWQSVVGATGYRVYVWTNAVSGASAGTAVWAEAMPGATNAASSTRLTDAKFNDCFENIGWTRSEKSGYPTGEDGTIRIGTTETNGWLQTPSIGVAADSMAVQFFAKANAANTKSMDVAVERVSGGSACFAGAATLTTEMQEVVIALPNWESGDSIRFNSLTNGDRRTVIGPIAVVSGYSKGTESPSYIVNGQDVGLATSCRFENLPSVPVFFAVETYGRRGVTSAKTEAVSVDLSSPDKVAELNACPLSSLAGGNYAQDFDSLAAVTATTGDKEWLNGTTLQYWQAYTNGIAVNSIKWNGGSSSTKGLYALRGGSIPSGSDRAFGACSVQGVETSFGIAFINDTDSAMTLSTLEYSAQQWGFGNTATQTLSVAAQVVDGLEWMSVYGAGWTELATTQSTVYNGEKPDAAVSTPVSVAPESDLGIAPGQVLMIKWTINPPAGGKAAMMGIDDVSVVFARLQTRGFAIRLADTSSHP